MDWIKKALGGTDAEELTPNKQKLAELLGAEIKDEESAGLLHSLLEKLKAGK